MTEWGIEVSVDREGCKVVVIRSAGSRDSRILQIAKRWFVNYKDSQLDLVE